MMRHIAISLTVIAGCMSATAFAADDPITARKDLMKSMGAAAGVGGGMLKGEIPFDPKVAMLVLATANGVSHSFGNFFPEGSDTGMETTASPKIWEDMGGFSGRISELQADTQAAFDSKPADLEAFKAAFGSVAENCKGCHENYRVKKN